MIELTHSALSGCEHDTYIYMFVVIDLILILRKQIPVVVHTKYLCILATIIYEDMSKEIN